MLANLDPSARRDLIATTLRDAQVQYAWADGAEPVAIFGLQLPHRPRLELSVRHSGTVLQLIAHRVLPGPRDPQRIADYDMLNQSWGVGQPETLVAMDRLNGRLDIGGVGLWYEHGIAYGWIGHFAPWFAITPEAVRWTSERAASWAEAAQILSLSVPS